MKQGLPKEAIAEMTLLTIQNMARWMEYEEGMEDFSLLEQIDPQMAENATVFLCGYIPELEMELAIVADAEKNRGEFYSVYRKEDAEPVCCVFDLQDYQTQFEPNMLMYAATTQIMMRNQEEAYHKVTKELAESKSCKGCSGCGN